MKANTNDYDTCDVLLTTKQILAVRNDRLHLEAWSPCVLITSSPTTRHCMKKLE